MKVNLDINQRIVNHLLLQGSFMDNVGLFHGKTGVAILFYHYSRYMRNSIYEEFGDELVQQIYDDIDNQMPINLENGLCGIAWGLCYLISSDFVEGDPEEVLSQIDEVIMERSPMRVKDSSIRTGLQGIQMYVRDRIALSIKQETNHPFNPDYLKEMEMAAKKVKLKMPPSPFSEMDFPNKEEQIEFLNLPLGLDHGCAGAVLHEIMAR
ncbi:lanthionine synthetase LanC family protein [Parapedobacter tibetensis]|nr:lanthionine synthetase LanC family protein [Parapedobacter tibetensis]